MMVTILRKIFVIIIVSILSTIIVVGGVYFKKVNDINNKYYHRYRTNSEVALRKFPYPYRAAIAISNDVDNTETLEEFIEILKHEGDALDVKILPLD